MDLPQLAAQLRKPQGEAGKKITEMMNRGNALLYQEVFRAFDPEPGQRVLEIGMASGFFARQLVRDHPGIEYHGIDFSADMVKQASLENQDKIKEGQMHFHLAQADQMPFPRGFFDLVFSVNTIYFWEQPEKELSEIRRVLAKEGRLVIGIRSAKTMEQMPFTAYGFRKYSKTDLEALLIKIGYRIISSIEHQEPPYLFEGNEMRLENIITVCN